MSVPDKQVYNTLYFNKFKIIERFSESTITSGLHLFMKGLIINGKPSKNKEVVEVRKSPLPREGSSEKKSPNKCFLGMGGLWFFPILKLLIYPKFLKYLDFNLSFLAAISVFHPKICILERSNLELYFYQIA